MKYRTRWLRGFVSWSFRLLSISIVVAACHTNGSAQDSGFIDRILSSINCKYCYFVALKVESNAYSGEIVIENDELMHFLVEVGETTESEYPTYVKKLLESGTALHIQNATIGAEGLTLNVGGISENQFRIPKPDGEMVKDLEGDCRSVIGSLFEFPSNKSTEKDLGDTCPDFIRSSGQTSLRSKGVLKAGNDAALIAKLFKWQLPVRIDHRSMALLIQP